MTTIKDWARRGIIPLLFVASVAVFALTIHKCNDETAHYVKSHCNFTNCVVNGRNCGSKCGDGCTGLPVCYNVICLDVTAVITEPNRGYATDFVTTYNVYTGDIYALWGNLTCERSVPGGVYNLPCHYDDRKGAVSLRYGSEIPDCQWMIGVILASVVLSVSGAFLLMLLLAVIVYCICGDMPDNKKTNGYVEVKN
jgi:hypothetical protein